MKRKNILKDAGVVLVALLMVLTTLVVTAHQTNNEVAQENNSADSPSLMDRLPTGEQADVEYTDIGNTANPVVFSFVIITDNHIHITKLTEIVNWINADIASATDDIRFVMVLGDLTDEGYNTDSSQLYNVKSVLTTLSVPYIPVIGNHDVWYSGTGSNVPAEIFNTVFYRQYESLGRYLPIPHFQKITNSQPTFYQDFSFDYMRYFSICMDWVSRSDYGASTRGWPEISTTTQTFLSSCFDPTKYNIGNENVLLFSHHPFSKKATTYSGSLPIAFKIADYNVLLNLLTPYASNINAWFAGHWHYPPEDPAAAILPLVETINDNSGSPMFTTIVTPSVSDYLNTYAPSVRVVKVHDNLNVKFSCTASGFSIRFVDHSNVNFFSRRIWDFGDGKTIGTFFPFVSHGYMPGLYMSYKVTLTVKSGNRQGSISNVISFPPPRAS